MTKSATPEPTFKDECGKRMTEAETPEPIFKIETIDDLKNVMTIAKGGNPDAIQALSNFINMNSNTERSYFPDKTTTLCIGQLNGFGKLYFPNDEWDPFTLVSDALSIAHMGYKGFKSGQFVDITRQTPNLSALETQSDSVKDGIIGRLFSRGKTE